MDSSPLSSRFTLSPKRSSRAEDLARELSSEEPGLSTPKELEAYVPDEWTDAPALHLDDQSAISTAAADTDDSYIQDRARLRARDGDYVVASPTHSDAYESYCRENLSLGDVEWLHPRVEGDPRKLANHCMRDRHLRHTLVHAIRRDRLRYIHPYSGSRDVWELAIMLHQRSRRTVEVVAPHPRLCEWVNDKASFAETASRLFGPQTIPETHSVWNLTTLAASVRELASQSAHIVLKLPDAAGGDGNLVLPAETYRNRSDKEIHRLLQDRLLGLAWHGDKRLLVSRWESPVAGAPSAQLWIPPGDAPPIIEGLFSQMLEGSQAKFVGFSAFELPSGIEEEIVDRCWQLARVFQQLGYIGRCSFDLILVGDHVENSRVEFIECNGRWGGTSLPMMLMHRLFGPAIPPYVARVVHHPTLRHVHFHDLVEAFGDDLFDVRSGGGRYILYNPSRMTARSSVGVVALGDSMERATRAAEAELDARLDALSG